MRIFLSGAQGTGKSTITNSIDLNLEKIDSISEKFFSSIDDFKSKDLIEKQYKISLYCLNLYINTNNFISSRSLADSYAYCMYSYNKTKDIRFKKLADLTIDLANLVRDDKHFYIPIEFQVESKNLRSKNLDFQKEIDSLILEYFNKTDLKYIKLSGSIIQRIKQLKEAL